MLKTKEEISYYVERYYQDLYTNDQQVEDNITRRERCLSSVPVVVTKEMNSQLISPFDVTEVGRVVRELPKDKGGGYDSIPADLFQEMWKFIKEDVIDFIRKTLEEGRLDTSVKYGLTTMVPKGGTQTLIKNFRSISVLPNLYKIIAKSMANRIQPITSNYPTNLYCFCEGSVYSC